METLKELLDTNYCSKCGACMAHCPLYKEAHLEKLVARGKIQLMKNLTEGNLDWNGRMRGIMEMCLMCKKCEANCPNGVHYGAMIQEARLEMVDDYQGSCGLVKDLIFRHGINKPDRVRLARALGYFYQQSGIQKAVRKSGIFRLAPKKYQLENLEKMVPEMAPRSFSEIMPNVCPAEHEIMRVGYFYGCMTNIAYPFIGEATIKVLNANGVTVVLPTQYCCGQPAWISGDRKSVLEQAQNNIQAFNDPAIRFIITDCASCGSMLKDYGEILGTEEAKTFSAKVRDISEFLVHEIDFKPGPFGVDRTITYHDPCHMVRYQNLTKEPRQLLKAIPGIKFIEMTDADTCCGGAGSFSVTHYELASLVGKRKVDNIRATGAQTLVTGCPACRMQIEAMCHKYGVNVGFAHTIELLAATYGDTPRRHRRV